MLQTYEAVLQPNGNLQFLDLPGMPNRAPCRVLVTFTEPIVSAPAPAGDWLRFAGALKDSPNLNGDPLAIQQAMRHEWE